jgi:ribosomal protein L11 methylase PrmA
MSKIDNILGKTLGNPTDYEEDEWTKMAIAFEDDNIEKVEKVLREKSYELAKYEEEIKQLCPTEDNIMKQIGHILFGSAVKKDKKEELYEDDSDFEDEIEQDVKETNKKNVDKKSKKEEDAGFDDDDDFEQEVKSSKKPAKKDDDEEEVGSETVLDDEDDEMPF